MPPEQRELKWRSTHIVGARQELEFCWVYIGGATSQAKLVITIEIHSPTSAKIWPELDAVLAMLTEGLARELVMKKLVMVNLDAVALVSDGPTEGALATELMGVFEYV